MNINRLEKINHETAARPFSIHHTYVGGDNTNALYVHCHPEAEFFFLEEGTISFCIEKEVYELHEGDAVFIPPYLTHNAEKKPGESCRYSALVFSLGWLSGYAGGEKNLYLNTLSDNRMESVMLLKHETPGHKEILDRLSHFGGYSELPIEKYEMRLIGEILINIQEIYNTVCERIKRQIKTDASKEGIRICIDYLLKHFDRHVTLAELSELSGYSESHFCHRFKVITGYTPFTFLNRIRVIKASERLIVSEDKITKIATDCGFDNISYFNRVFREQMGMPPKQYRSGKLIGL
jgi:AraC-like DNA-binding protein